MSDPLSLRTTKLLDLVDVMQAGTRPAGGATVKDGAVPSLGGENVGNDSQLALHTVRTIPRSFFEGMKRGQLAPGDVLINKDGAQTGKVARYTGEFDQAAINEHLFLLRPDYRRCTAGYLYWAMISDRVQRQIARFITGSAQPGLGQGFLAGVAVPEPGLDEQRVVVEPLDWSQRQIEARKRCLAKLEQFRDGLAAESFSESESTMMPLQALVAAPICYGIVQPGRHTPAGVPVVTIRDVRRRFAGEMHRAAPFLDAQYARSRVEPGDLVVSIKGTIGVVGVVPDGFSGNISRDVARVRTRGQRVLSAYLEQYFRSAQGLRTLERAVVGTTRAEISIGVLNRIRVPVPPLTDQQKTAALLQAADARIDLERSGLLKLQATHRGLVDSLIHGSTRTQAPVGHAV